jgi:hypothetical protein
MDNVIIAKKLSYLSDVLDQSGFSKEANTVDDVMLRIASINVRLAQTASGDYQKDIETYRDMIARGRYTDSESFYKDATSKMRQIDPATEQAFRAQAYRIRLTYKESDKAGNVGLTGQSNGMDKFQALVSKYGLYSGHPNAPKTKEDLDARFQQLAAEAYNLILPVNGVNQRLTDVSGYQQQITATYNLLLSQIAKQSQVQSPYAYANEQARREREEAYQPDYGNMTI